MAKPTEDLTADELSWIADRLAKVLDGGMVRSFVGLQYRLGEVGQNRIAPRMLQRALAELSNNRRPRRGRIREAGPWELTPGVFADSGLSPAIAQSDAAQVTNGVQRLIEAGRAGTLDRLCTVVAAGVADTAPTMRYQVEPLADETSIAGVTAPFSDTRLLSTTGNPPV